MYISREVYNSGLIVIDSLLTRKKYEKFIKQFKKGKILSHLDN